MFKQKTRPKMNYDWIVKTIRKKLIQTWKKTVKIKAAFENTSEKANVCSNTVFSLDFKIRANKFHSAKPMAFSIHFLYGRDQNHYSKLTSKIVKMCEHILIKKTAPQYSSNSLKCKNHDVSNKSRNHFAAIKQKCW